MASGTTPSSHEPNVDSEGLIVQVVFQQFHLTEWETACTNFADDAKDMICGIPWHGRHLHLASGTAGPLTHAEWVIRFAGQDGGGSCLSGLIEGGNELVGTEISCRLANGRLVLTGFGRGPGVDRWHWCACLTKAVRRKGIDDRVCLIGTLSAGDEDGSPTACRLILANYDIGREDIRLLERDIPVAFLNG